VTRGAAAGCRHGSSCRARLHSRYDRALHASEVVCAGRQSRDEWQTTVCCMIARRIGEGAAPLADRMEAVVTRAQVPASRLRAAKCAPGRVVVWRYVLPAVRCDWRHEHGRQRVARHVTVEPLLRRAGEDPRRWHCSQAHQVCRRGDRSSGVDGGIGFGRTSGGAIAPSAPERSECECAHAKILRALHPPIADCDASPSIATRRAARRRVAERTCSWSNPSAKGTRGQVSGARHNSHPERRNRGDLPERRSSGHAATGDQPSRTTSARARNGGKPRRSGAVNRRTPFL